LSTGQTPRLKATGGALRCAGWLALALMLGAGPALAQDDPAAELDALSRETATSAGGLALARNLSGSGDLLGALAALDRVLMLEPASKPALLLRAGLLCRIDDKAGGVAQLARLKKRDYPRQEWNEASGACAKPETAPGQRSNRWMRPGF
jgi:hypothetical protein